MQSPILVFDHVHKRFGLIETGPRADKKLVELVALQSKQIATSGIPAPR